METPKQATPVAKKTGKTEKAEVIEETTEKVEAKPKLNAVQLQLLEEKKARRAAAEERAKADGIVIAKEKSPEKEKEVKKAKPNAVQEQLLKEKAARRAEGDLRAKNRPPSTKADNVTRQERKKS
jgi:hypothetical protein